MWDIGWSLWHSSIQYGLFISAQTKLKSYSLPVHNHRRPHIGLIGIVASKTDECYEWCVVATVSRTSSRSALPACFLITDDDDRLIVEWRTEGNCSWKDEVTAVTTTTVWCIFLPMSHLTVSNLSSRVASYVFNTIPATYVICWALSPNVLNERFPLVVERKRWWRHNSCLDRWRHNSCLDRTSRPVLPSHMRDRLPINVVLPYHTRRRSFISRTAGQQIMRRGRWEGAWQLRSS